MNLETKITIYKFTPQVFTLTRYKVPLAVPCNTISNRSPLRNLLYLCTELPDKGKEVKHAKGKSLEMFHNLLFKIQFHR